MRLRRASLLLALAFAAFYAATTRGQFVFGDDVLVFQVTESILDGDGFAVASPAGRGDVARAVAGRDGRGYSKYGLGLSLAALPFDLGGRLAERAGAVLPETLDAEGNPRTGTRVFAAGLTNAVAGALVVAAMFWLATEAGFAAGVAALLAAALGGATFFAHYAATFLSEPLAAAALTGAAAAALEARSLALRVGVPGAGQRRARSARPGPAPEAGEAHAAAAFSAGGARRVGARVMLRGRRAAWAVALSGALAGFAVLVKVAHLVAALPIGVWLVLALARAPRAWGAAGRDSWRALHRRAVRDLALVWASCFSIFLAAVAAYNALRFGSPFETGYGEEAARLTTPLWLGLAGLVVSPGKGVLWYAPPLLLAVFGLRALGRRRPEVVALLLAMSIGPLLLTAAYYQWHGGGAWGPRLLVPYLPLWLLPAGEVLTRAGRGSARARIGSALALGAGALVVALALFVPFDRYHERVWPAPREPDPARLDAMIWNPEASPLVVHARALPGAVAETALLLAGAAPLPGPTEKDHAGLPDVAFARYGSHVLLQWTRGFLAVALLAAAWGLRELRRAR
jgi:hypothetical protein